MRRGGEAAQREEEVELVEGCGSENRPDWLQAWWGRSNAGRNPGQEGLSVETS
jgi:hypothetical protein